MLLDAPTAFRFCPGELPGNDEVLGDGDLANAPPTVEGDCAAYLKSSGESGLGLPFPFVPLPLLCSRLVLKARTKDFFPDLVEELLDTAVAEEDEPLAPLDEQENEEASLDDKLRALAEDLMSLLPRDSVSLRELVLVVLDFEALFGTPFLSLSLLKNLNLSNIEFLLPEDDEDVEGLEDELLDEEVEEVELALVRLDCLSPPEAGRPRPTGVGMPDEDVVVLGEAARICGTLELLLFGGANEEPRYNKTE